MRFRRSHWHLKDPQYDRDTKRHKCCYCGRKRFAVYMYYTGSTHLGNQKRLFACNEHDECRLYRMRKNVDC